MAWNLHRGVANHNRSLSLHPRLFSKYVKAGLYFLFVSGLFEYVGTSLDYWNFPGRNFLGWMPFFGQTIPYEEFTFFIALISLALISYYELTDDDCR